MYLANEFSHFEAGIQYDDNKFRRNIILTLNEFAEFKSQNQKFGLFTTAYRYDGPNIREANMIGNLYIDFDISDINTDYDKVKEDVIRTISAFKAIFGIDKEMINIYFSGNKGLHLIIPAEVLGIGPHEELNNIFKLIAQDMNKLVKNQTIDTQIYDKVRLFRIPNSLHPKTGLYKIPISFEELRTLSLGEIQELAKETRTPAPLNRRYNTQANRIYNGYVDQWENEKAREAKRKKRSKSSTLSFMPPCIQYILDNGVKEGKRNNTVAVLASYFMQRGVKENEALDRLVEWNSQYCQPELPIKELEKTVTSIYRAEHRYGCRTLKELSECSSICRLYKEPGRD